MIIWACLPLGATPPQPAPVVSPGPQKARQGPHGGAGTAGAGGTAPVQGRPSPARQPRLIPQPSRHPAWQPHGSA